MMRSQLRWIWSCSLLLFVPLLVPLATGRVFTKDDLGAMHLPFRYLYREALRNGDSILWTPALLSGFFLHGEGEAGLTHPLHFLLYRTLPLGPAFNLEIIGSYVAMFAGTGLLLRRLALSAEAAWFGAMVFTFSGFNLFNLMHVNHIAAVAHAPWLLLGAHVLVTAADRWQRAAAFAFVSLVTGSQVLVGNPQYVWLSLIAIAFMAACLLYARAPLGRVSSLPLALGCGALIGAVQLLPTAEFALASTRAGWPLEQRLSFSLSPLNLIQLVSPFAFRFRVAAPSSESQIVHEFIVYNGAFCTIALAWIVIRWRQLTRRALLTALLVFAALSLVLAFGRYGVVSVWLAQLPGLSAFRAPARHLVLFQLALAGIAAVVFEDMLGLIRRGERLTLRSLRLLAIPAIIGVVIAIAAAMLADSAWAASRDLQFSGLLRALPWCVPIAAMTLAVAAAARGVRWAVPALIVLAALDQALWGYSYALRWGPVTTIDELVANASVPPGAVRGESIAPMIGGPINLPIFHGLRLATAYAGVEPASRLDPGEFVTERIAGVSWRPAGTKWARVADTMPRARLLPSAVVSADIRTDIHRIDISRAALVDRRIDDLTGAPGTAHVVEDRPGAMLVETSAAGRQLLVVTERFHGGWRVTVDGLERAAVRVYGDFLGCIVDAGTHRVGFRFAPSSVRDGILASAAGLALAMIGAVFVYFT